MGFAERSESIALLGAGGNGKTTIALTLLHHARILIKFGPRRHFIRCHDLGGLSDEFPGRLSEAIGAHDLKDMAQLRSHLLLSSPSILVLDGVESILNPLALGVAEIVSAIKELSRCQNLCLLVTGRVDGRITDFCCVEVPTLSVDGAKDVFYSRCHLGRLVEVNNLLEELDFHPLSIDLLASTTRENDWDKAALLEAWDGGKANILQAYGRQSLEDNIKLTLCTPTIQAHGMTALNTLRALAERLNGVEEREPESTFAGVAEIGDVIDALCKFFLVYCHDGFVKMLAPFRFYFRGPTETPILRSGSGIAHDPAVEDIQYSRPDVADSSLFFFVPPARGNNF